MKNIIPRSRDEYLTLLISAAAICGYLLIWFRG